MCDLETEMFQRRSCEIFEKEDVRLVYYEDIKRDLKIILRYECRCNEKLKVKGGQLASKTGNGEQIRGMVSGLGSVNGCPRRRAL